MPTLTDLKTSIGEAMDADGRSIAELRDATGISQATLLDVRRGIRDPKLSTVALLAAALGVSMDELCSTQLAAAVKALKPSKRRRR